MVLEIQFIKGIKEIISPIVKITKSVNGQTGTATFLFIYPNSLDIALQNNISITGMTLLSENQKIYTSDLTLFFKNGKPFLIKSILIFKNSNEWFYFLNFMNLYSKEKGLLFELE